LRYKLFIYRNFEIICHPHNCLFFNDLRYILKVYATTHLTVVTGRRNSWTQRISVHLGLAYPPRISILSATILLDINTFTVHVAEVVVRPLCGRTTEFVLMLIVADSVAWAFWHDTSATKILRIFP
jgi:hypothetical protein